MDDMGGRGSGGHNEKPENRALTESLRIAFDGDVPPAVRAKAKAKGIKAIRRINAEKAKKKGGK
jgi:hypothetical protein